MPMHEAKQPHLGVHVPAPPPGPSAAAATALAQNRLLVGLEAILEPAIVVLSLWFLVWLLDGELTSAWLVASIVAFALSFPGRSLLRSPADRVVFNILLAWGWTAGLMLALGFATDHIYDFPAPVIVHWLWFAPACQLVAHWALRLAAPHLVRLQGPPLRAVVVGMNEQGAALADRINSAPYAGIELVGFFDDRTPDRQFGAGRHRMLGRIADIATIVKSHRVQLIYLSLPMASQPHNKKQHDALKDTTASVYFVPDMFVTDLI